MKQRNNISSLKAWAIMNTFIKSSKIFIASIFLILQRFIQKKNWFRKRTLHKNRRPWNGPITKIRDLKTDPKNKHSAAIHKNEKVFHKYKVLFHKSIFFSTKLSKIHIFGKYRMHSSFFFFFFLMRCGLWRQYV